MPSTIPNTDPSLTTIPALSRFKRTLLSFVIGDAVLVLFLTFGYVFPSHMTVPQPGQAMPESYYDFSAKSSPLEIPREPKRIPAQSIPRISARSLPLTPAGDAAQAAAQNATSATLVSSASM